MRYVMYEIMRGSCCSGGSTYSFSNGSHAMLSFPSRFPSLVCCCWCCSFPGAHILPPPLRDRDWRL